MTWFEYMYGGYSVESRLNTFQLVLQVDVQNLCEHRICDSVCQGEFKHDSERANKMKKREESEMLLGNFLNGNCIN